MDKAITSAMKVGINVKMGKLFTPAWWNPNHFYFK